MHPYLRFNLTYIDTEAFIHILASLAAREEVSGKTGIMNSFIKYDTQLTWFTRNFPRRVREVSAGKRRTFKNCCFLLSPRYLVVAIYFLHSADNKLRQYFLLQTPNDNFAISSFKVDLVCKSVVLSGFGSLGVRLVNFKYISFVCTM